MKKILLRNHCNSHFPSLKEGERHGGEISYSEKVVLIPDFNCANIDRLSPSALL